MMGNRYRLYEGSASSHCCFHYSILDTEEYEFTYEGDANRESGGYYDCVAECFEYDHAVMLLKLLNNNDIVHMVDEKFESPYNPAKSVKE